MYRDTKFMIIKRPEMYRDTIFKINVNPDMYHDTVFIGGVFPCLHCGCMRASLCLLFVLGAPDKHVVPRSFLSRFTVVKFPMQKRVN